MKWQLRLFAVVLAIFIIDLLWEAQEHYVYEKSIDSLHLTFADFKDVGGLPYEKALKTAGKETFAYDFPETSLQDTSPHIIPRIIHFIWFKDLYGSTSGSATTSIPKLGSEAPKICRENNPNFKVELWNATASKELLERHYAWFIPTYESYPHPIQRVDAIKYFILWHYGGIYMDLDVACRKSLEPLIHNPAWFPRASPMGVNNDIMASRAGHPLLWKMVDNLKRRNKNLISPWLTIFWTTGPKFTSDMLEYYLHDHGVYGRNNYEPKKEGEGNDQNKKERERKDKDPNAVYVLPREFYSEEYTFFGHSTGGTWHGNDVAVVLWFANRPYLLWSGLTVFIILGILLMIRKRRTKIIRLVPNKINVI